MNAAGDIDHEVEPRDLCARAWTDAPWVGEAAPSLSWRLWANRSAVRQIGYEIELARDPYFEIARQSSGEIQSPSSVAAAWPGRGLTSREVRWARVRVRTERGWTSWSAPLKLEAALLAQEDWRARPISPRANVARMEAGPAALVRRSFSLPAEIVHARLYVTALGVHETWINGRPLSDVLLAPGWTAYRGRVLYDAYDVAHLLRAGDNAIAAAIGDGWWRGNLTWMDIRGLYGHTTAYLAQLEIVCADGASVVVGSDEHWQGGEGAIRAADLYDGCRIDLRAGELRWREPDFDASHWGQVVALDAPQLELRAAPAVRVVERRKLTLTRRAPGVLALDTGQNFAGYLKISASGAMGAKLKVRHAEVRDDEGGLFTAPLRNAKATDEYVLGWDGPVELRPFFTFHGFRYAEIEHDAAVEIEAVEAHVVSSDLENIGEFQCSNGEVNRLFENVRWSQRANFLSLPTDCPQRDERMGWTGDIQAFAATACANADAQTFLASWLKDLAIEQRSDGCVPSTVPNVIAGHDFEYAGVAWGDAATLVPWRLYLAFGDSQILRAQFSSMRAWVDYGASRLSQDHIWVGDFHLGDWLDPAAPPDRPGEGLTERDFIASAYLAHSAATLAEAADVLGERAISEQYRALSRKVAQATWRKWRAHALSTQTGCAIAIGFDIAPEEQHREIAGALAILVERSGGRIGTGFVGTPLVLPALTRGGRADAAYRLLLNERCPGWLYQVQRGATTIWERWDAIGEDGRIHAGDMAAGAAMTSFNHYAYGAVAAWLYESVAGIAPDARGPGYRLIKFAPQPGGGLTWARASIVTPLGRNAIAWFKHDDGALQVELEIAPGAEGEFTHPDGWVGSTQARFGSGRHALYLVRA